MNYKLYAIIVVMTLGTILGIGINSMYQTVQATICPIDQVEEHLEAANTAYNEQNYIEVKNSLDSIQELVDSVKEEE